MTDDPRVLSLSRLVALRIGVAEFSLGNILLLSFPSYLGLADASGETYSRLFG